jgi:hypothetical protein
MRALLTRLSDALADVVGLVLPLPGGTGGGGPSGRGVRAAPHLALLAFLLLGLYVLNRLLGLDRKLAGAGELIRQLALPLLFLLFYALCWLSWWLFKLLSTGDGAEFPDISAAWEEARATLGRGGIDVRDLPLFLVLGRTKGPPERLFRAAGLELTVPPTPARPDAPLHVCATAQAVYVACPGASLLGRQASSLAGGTAQGRDPGEADRAAARFGHLCRLLVRDRRPYCPVNGVLVLLPFAATAKQEDALATGAAVRGDLAAARRLLGVNAPTLALVCDVESAPGFAAFLSRFNEAERKRRVGQRCPLVPHLPGGSGRPPDQAEEARARMFESLSRWLCGSVVPGWVYKKFDAAASGADPEAVRTNARLFLFMHELRERQHWLGRLLAEGLATDGGPVLFGGCYLGGTGDDPEREQAFVPGVFKRLAEEENCVTWTPQARQDEEAVQRWAGVAQAVLVGLSVTLVALLGYLFFGPKAGAG